MYKQELYNILEDYIKPSTLKKYNRHKSWKYGYDEQHDMVAKLTTSPEAMKENPERLFLR